MAGVAARVGGANGSVGGRRRCCTRKRRRRWKKKKPEGEGGAVSAAVLEGKWSGSRMAALVREMVSGGEGEERDRGWKRRRKWGNGVEDERKWSAGLREKWKGRGLGSGRKNSTGGGRRLLPKMEKKVMVLGLGFFCIFY